MPQLKYPETPEEVLVRTYGMGKPEAAAVAARIENASLLVQVFKLHGGAGVRDIVAKSNAFPVPPKVVRGEESGDNATSKIIH